MSSWLVAHCVFIVVVVAVVLGFVCDGDVCSRFEHARQDSRLHQLPQIRWQGIPLDHLWGVHTDEWAGW